MVNIMQMMQKAQAAKQKVGEMQEKIRAIDVTGEAGGGLVRIVLSGRGDARSVKIDAKATGDVELLEDMVKVAINDARSKADRLLSEETQRVMKELGLPPGMDLF